MTIYVGGLRQRLIKDSLYRMLYESSESLGWFNPGRFHKPILFRATAVPTNEEIQLNTVVLSDESVDDVDWELGSLMSEHRSVFYLDIFAEDESVGVHLSGDLRAILGGRMPSIGRIGPSFEVLDLTMATPVPIFNCEIERVTIDRAHDFPKPWQRFWYVIRFEVLDYHGTEDD